MRQNRTTYSMYWQTKNTACATNSYQIICRERSVLGLLSSAVRMEQTGWISPVRMKQTGWISPVRMKQTGWISPVRMKQTGWISRTGDGCRRLGKTKLLPDEGDDDINGCLHHLNVRFYDDAPLSLMGHFQLASQLVIGAKRPDNSTGSTLDDHSFISKCTFKALLLCKPFLKPNLKITHKYKTTHIHKDAIFEELVPSILPV